MQCRRIMTAVLVAGIWAVGVVGCGGSGTGGGGGSAPAISGTHGTDVGEAHEPVTLRGAVAGTVRDVGGSPVPNATVEISLDRNGDGIFERAETAYVTTDPQGGYAWSPKDAVWDREIRARIRAEAPGYLPLQRVTMVSPGTGVVTVDLTLQQGVNAEVEQGRIEAEVPVDTQGTRGNVSVVFEELETPLPQGATARVAYVNPASMMSAFPGELAGRSQSGNDALLVSAGVVEVQVRGPDGTVVEPRGKITVTAPLPRELWWTLNDADPSTPDRVEVPLWWYDDELGRWVQAQDLGFVVDAEGNPVAPSDLFDIVFGTADPGELRVTGTVPHLSSWNFDYYGPMTGLTGKLADDVEGAGVCAAGGYCAPVDPDGSFRVPVPKPVRPLGRLDLLSNLMSDLAEEANEKFGEDTPPGSGNAGPCEDVQAVAARSLERAKRQAKALLRNMLNDYRDNDEIRQRVLAAYKTIHRAENFKDISTGLKHVMNAVPGLALAEKYGGNFMAYFEESSYEDALGSLIGTLEGLGALREAFGDVDITTCQDVASEVLNIETDLKANFINEMKAYAQAKGDVQQFADMKNRFTGWWTGVAKSLINNQAFVKCVKELVRNAKNLPQGSKALGLIKALKETGATKIWVQGEGKTLWNFRKIFKGGKLVLEGGKTVDGSGVLLGLLLDEILLAVKQKKEIMPKALDFEYWQRLQNAIHANARISSRFVSRYRREMERGNISSRCYERILRIAGSKQRGTSRLAHAAGDEAQSEDEALDAIEALIRNLEDESPEAAEIMDRLYYRFLATEAAYNQLLAVGLVQGKVETYDQWTDAHGKPAAPPSDSTGGGSSVRIYVVDSWDRPHELTTSDQGVDPNRVGVPNAAEYRGDPAIRFRDVGTFALKEPLHVFRGRVVDEEGEPVDLAWAWPHAWVRINEGASKRLRFRNGRFEVFGIRVGDRIAVGLRDAVLGRYAIGEEDLDRETYREIPIRHALVIVGASFKAGAADHPERVGFHLTYRVLPEGRVEDWFGSAALVSVQDLDTGEELLENPLDVGLDGNGSYTLPGGGRYRFRFHVVDTTGAAREADAVYMVPADTIRAGPIEVLTDLTSYAYGQPIRFRVQARDEKGLPVHYRWSVSGDAVAGEEPKGIDGPDYEVIPVLEWDPASGSPPTIQVAVKVWSALDEAVLHTEVQLPSPDAAPQVSCEVSGTVEGGVLRYRIGAEGHRPGTAFVVFPPELQIKALRVFLDENLLGEVECGETPVCTATEFTSPAPGPHQLRAVVEDTRGETGETRISIVVPEAVEISDEPDAQDDFSYTFGLNIRYPEGTSPGEARVSWSFDALTWTESSTSLVAHHTYEAYGDYRVYARVSLADGVDLLLEKPVSVEPRVTPVASEMSGTVPLSVSFELRETEGLAHVTGFRWDPIGDADPETLPLSSDTSFEHTYTEAGLYTPRVFLELDDGSRVSISLTQDPLVVSSPVELAIAASPSDGPTPLTVAFSATAELPGQAYAWDFNGDGEVDETTAEPLAEHTFTEPGDYRVRVTGTFGESRYSASVVVHVRGLATVLLGDGSSPLGGVPVYRFSTADPFVPLRKDETADDGSLAVQVPAMVGYVHAEPDYAAYRLHYVAGEGTTELTDSRVLETQTVFSGLDDPDIYSVGVYGSNGVRAVPASEISSGTVTVQNVSKLCYAKDGARLGVYLVDVERRTAYRRAPLMIAPQSTHTYYLVRDVPLSQTHALVDLDTLSPLGSASLTLDVSPESIYPNGAEAWVRVTGVPVEIPAPVRLSGSTVTLPQIPDVESLRLVVRFWEAEWGSVGLVEMALDADALSALKQTGEASLPLALELKTVQMPAGWSVCQEHEGACYALASEYGDEIHVVYPQGAADAVRLRIRNASSGSWTVSARPSDLPDAWSVAPVAVSVEAVSASVDADTGDVRVTYTPAGGAQSCSVWLWPDGDPGQSLDLRADNIPVSVTDMVFQKMESGLPWFDAAGVTGVSAQVTCCDAQGACATAVSW